MEVTERPHDKSRSRVSTHLGQEWHKYYPSIGQYRTVTTINLRYRTTTAVFSCTVKWNPSKHTQKPITLRYTFFIPVNLRLPTNTTNFDTKYNLRTYLPVLTVIIVRSNFTVLPVLPYQVRYYTIRN